MIEYVQGPLLGDRPVMPPMSMPDLEMTAELRRIRNTTVCLRYHPDTDLSYTAVMRRLGTAATLRRIRTPEEEGEEREAIARNVERAHAPERSRAWVAEQMVLTVAPNPKKMGSESRERYAHWRVGETIGAAIARGLRKDDVNWDMSHGFVTIGPAAIG